ncbi:MAG: hypothetical protein IKM44_00765 [Clostridia bacterium]|nr:hypothetical protein [Clostridia bacterium]
MSKIKDKISALREKIKNIRHIEIILAVVAVLIMLLIYFSNSCKITENSGISTSGNEYDYCTRVVDELENKLSEIQGVGDVSVLISWSYESDTAESIPKAEGVIIICDGGNNISVKMKLISSVSAYFGISENKINVLTKITK